jgi:hypothetical protein
MAAERQKSDLLQGTLDVLILKVVALGPTHGSVDDSTGPDRCGVDVRARCRDRRRHRSQVTGFARRILFGLAPTEPGVFVVAASVLACAAILAAWLPVRRASRVDPLVALRDE